MSTLTLELTDEANTLLKTEAQKVNLSPSEFARLAIVRALARLGQDPQLSHWGAKADGQGWVRIRELIPDVLPQSGDESPPRMGRAEF